MKSTFVNLLAQTPDRLLTEEEKERLTGRAATGDRERIRQLRAGDLEKLAPDEG